MYGEIVHHGILCVNGTISAAIALEQFYGTILIGSHRPMCGLHKLLFSLYVYFYCY